MNHGPPLPKRTVNLGRGLVVPYPEPRDANATAIVTTAARIGASPLAFADRQSSALLLTLPAGHYTFIARGGSSSSGIVLVEVYDAD